MEAETARQDLATLRRAVRVGDPVRGLAAPFAPDGCVPAVLALVALNLELARIPGLVRQKMGGLVRYQWWRDGLDQAAVGTPDDHPVLRALAPALAGGGVDLGTVQALVDAREADLEPMAAEGDAMAWATRRAGALHRLIAAVGGTTDWAWLDRAQAVGTAFALVGPLPPSFARLAGQERARLAIDLLQRRGPRARVPRSALPALLPALATAADARTLLAGRQVSSRRPLLPLRYAWAALAGRIG